MSLIVPLLQADNLNNDKQFLLLRQHHVKCFVHIT